MADLDSQVRAADPDRWLSSRFVGDRRARADLIALYAFEAELMVIPTKVTQPLMAEMRFTWWADQMDGVFSGDPRRGHPVLEALSAAVTRHGLGRTAFDALIEAHVGRVHGEPHDLDAFYIGPMQAAVTVLAGPGHEAAAEDAARVWGLDQTGRREGACALRSTANRALRLLPVKAFPAVAHVALVGADGPDATKRLRLIWASIRGRI